MGYRKHGVSEAPGPGRWAKHSVQQWVMTWEEQKKVFFSFAGFEDGLADGWIRPQSNTIALLWYRRGNEQWDRVCGLGSKLDPIAHQSKKAMFPLDRQAFVFGGLRHWFDELCTYQYTPPLR
jgi:hypothetical protein